MPRQLELLPIPSSHFIEKKEPKKDGSFRDIHKPDKEAREFHEELLERLYELDFDMPYATGGVKGKSLIDNVKPHVDSKIFYMLDIRDAYPSVNGESLAIQLTELGIFDSFEEAQELLARWCLDPRTGGLMQGPNASPYLFNLALSPLDDVLGAWCEERNLVYTRFFDDVTISAPSGETIGQKRRRAIRDIIKSDGWQIKDGKTRIHKSHMPVTITGIALQPSGYWRIAPQHIRKVLEVFGEAWQIVESGGELSKKELGRLHGYHGVVISSYDERRGRPTQVEQNLLDFYDEIMRQIAANRGQRGAKWH